jgi:deoxyribodipyrimidine photo-lyase
VKVSQDRDTTVVWLRRDLRLADNPALVEAACRGGAVVPLVLWPEGPGSAAPFGSPAGAGRWWLRRSLLALDAELRRRGGALVVRRGAPSEAVATAALDAQATRVVWARGIDPDQHAEDEAVRRALAETGVEPAVVASPGLLIAPDTVATAQGTPYQVFTPFWRAVSSQLRPPAPLPTPDVLTSPAAFPAGSSFADFEEEVVGLWTAGFAEVWQPGEAGAHARLDRLLDDVLPAYADDRDRPDLEGSSRLSPHLHFGELSARQVWHAVAGRLAEAGLEPEAATGPPSRSETAPSLPETVGSTARSPQTAATAALARGAGAFLRQLGWREFAHHLLWHFPDTVTRPLQGRFAVFPWRDDLDGLAAWQRGRTGFPFVDAAMRCLWATGWMHNRARLVAGSFLVKDLLLPWQSGATWFWDALVDADLANNTLGWQWVAGCGADAAPYFRIFNPVKQGERFDPGGAFVRRWVPELAELPARWVHAPWAAPANVLAEAGVRLGETYPAPIVDHGEARSRALAAYEVVKLAR